MLVYEKQGCAFCALTALAKAAATFFAVATANIGKVFEWRKAKSRL
jgi:hypothetical protein